MKRKILRTVFVVLSLAVLLLSADDFSLQSQPSPIVTTLQPQSVTDTGAILKGAVTPNGNGTRVNFVSCDSSSSPNYFPPTAEEFIGSGLIGIQVSHSITGLSPGIAYSYKVRAWNGFTTVFGSCVTFTTPAPSPSTLGPPPTALPGVIGAPTVQTLPATNVTQTSATLNGNVNANSLDTTVDFISCDSSGSPSYFYPTSPQYLAGTFTQPVWSALSGLKPGTTYKYRVRATNSAGTEMGSCVTFTTSGSSPGQTVPPLPGVIGVPTVQTLSASNVTGTSAKLNATVNPNSLTTSVDFISCDPISSPGYFSSTTFQNVSGTLTVTVSLTLMGLKPGVAYNYRARAANTAGTEMGNCVMFVTSSAQTTQPPTAPPSTTLPPVTQSPAVTSAPPATTTAPAQPPIPPSNNPPKANAGSDKNIVAGSVVNFDGSASSDPDGNVLTYQWDFGDGTNGSGEKSRHSYSRPRQYAVSLTVSDGQYSDTAYVTVFVSEKPSGFALGGNMLLYVGLGLIALLLLIIIIVMLARK